jgi:hypothetical protein
MAGRCAVMWRSGRAAMQRMTATTAKIVGAETPADRATPVDALVTTTAPENAACPAPTNGRPVSDSMQAAALPLFRAGHIPVTGEDLAIPLAVLAGSTRFGDAAFTEVFHPYAERLVLRCDGVLRIGGASAGADAMVELARRAGKAVYFSTDDISQCHKGSMSQRP